MTQKTNKAISHRRPCERIGSHTRRISFSDAIKISILLYLLAFTVDGDLRIDRSIYFEYEDVAHYSLALWSNVEIEGTFSSAKPTLVSIVLRQNLTGNCMRK